MVGPFPTPESLAASLASRQFSLTIGSLNVSTSTFAIRPGGESHDGDTLAIVTGFSFGQVGLIFWGGSEALCPFAVCDVFNPVQDVIPTIYP